jgi:hypothetical protein
MARSRLPDSARVPIGLHVSEADAARIDEVLRRPEFAGWNRSEWCVVIIRTALRYYVGDAAEPDPGQSRAAARSAAPQRVPPSRPPVPGEAGSPAVSGSGPAARHIPAASPGPAAGHGAALSPGPAVPPGTSEPGPAPAEPPAQPECLHPPAARDYQTGACVACGAILWD